MLSIILGFIPSLVGPVMNYLTKLRDTQVAMYQSRFGASKDVAVAALQAQAAVQSKWWFAALPPAIIGLSYASYLVKSVFWDKVVGSFVGCYGKTAPGTCTLFQTDPLSADLNWVMTAVILSYFGAGVAMKMLNTRS